MQMKILVIIVCALIASGCAHQDDILILDQRLARMEQLGRELDAKTRQLESEYDAMRLSDRKSSEAFAKNSAALQEEIEQNRTNREEESQKIRSQYAGINANIVELRDDLQAVRGNLEETGYMVTRRLDASDELGREIQVKLEKVARDLGSIETRVQYIEQYLNLESEKAKGQVTTENGDAGKTLSEDELYVSSKQAFDQGDFDKARAGFDKILKDFPKSKHADNAQFWIGEIYYREKWYEKAILEYQKVIENYPKGNKVPASLLKQGFAFLSLGDKANARLILEELARKYPETNEGKIAVQKLKEIS